MPHLSVVIPVFQGENTLTDLYLRLKKTLLAITPDYEIILIDDGSTDLSWTTIENLAKKDKKVKGLKFVRNFGQHVAITAGLDLCNGDYVVVMDCDLQDPPEEIENLYKKIKTGYHVVLAKRKERKDHFFKKLSSYLFYKVLSFLSGKKYDSQVGCFRIISSQVVKNYRLMKDQVRFFISLVEWMGFPTTTIDIIHSPRSQGRSTYSFRKLLRLAVDIIISNSEKPLQLLIGLGFITSSSSFIAAIWIATRKILFNFSIPGWSSLIISIFFMGGLILLNLGLLGSYILKIFEQVKNRPLYIALQEVGFDKKKETTIIQ